MTMPIDATLEAVIRRDRVVVLTALFAVITLSWAYLLAGAGMDMSAFEMTGMSQAGMATGIFEGGMAGMAMMTPADWTAGYAVLMFFMWWAMGLAMMLPSAAPMILLFAAVNRRQRDAGHPYVATVVFTFGYLAVWAGFSLVAVILQWGFERTGILSPMLAAANAIFGGSLLLAAGVYQLTPIKHACLRHCRSPLAFLATHWRQGARGALRMGLLHGTFCVGCCWFLMGLMFFGGVMNLYWVAGLALFVLFEKTVPAGHWLGYAAGVVLLVWGAAMLVLALQDAVAEEIATLDHHIAQIDDDPKHDAA
jgi:predicted metal-binding membrane protein